MSDAEATGVAVHCFHGASIALKFENGLREIGQEHDTNHCRYDHHGDGHYIILYLNKRVRLRSGRSLRASFLIAFAVAKSMTKNMVIDRRISAIAVILSASKRP
jgi:hypothetical protein